MDRYHEALANIGTDITEEVMKKDLEKIMEKAPGYAKPEVYNFLLGSIDLTTLSTTDSPNSVAAFTKRVNDFEEAYPQYAHVAAICVYSNFAEVVRTHLDVTGVNIAVVAGGFPSSQTFTAVKIADTALATEAGANEVDIVMNLGYFLDEDYESLSDEIIEIRHTARKARVKVILETGALKSIENIRKASVLSLYSEADFLKTSTGKIYDGASLEAVYVMCKCIKDYYDKTGRRVGIKASGGVRTTEEALRYYTLVKEVLGDEWLTPEYFRIGASSLANAVLSSLENKEVKFF